MIYKLDGEGGGLGEDGGGVALVEGNDGGVIVGFLTM